MVCVGECVYVGGGCVHMRAGDLEIRGVGSFKDEMKESPDVMWVLGTRCVLSRNSVCSLDNCAIFLAPYYRALILNLIILFNFEKFHFKRDRVLM